MKIGWKLVAWNAAWLLGFCLVVAAQDVKIISRELNFTRIVSAWNGIPLATRDYNLAAEKAEGLIHKLKPNKPLSLNERKELVMALQAARDACSVEQRLLNELIDELDWRN